VIIPLLAASCGGGGAAPASNPPPVPDVSLSTTSVNFGSQTVGTTSAAQSVTLTNTGNAMLSIASISATGDFATTNVCGGGIAPGQNCTISVTFTPWAAGARTGSVNIVDNAAGSPHTVTLIGTGQSPTLSIQLSPGTLIATQDGAPSSAGVTVTRTGGASSSVSLSLTGLPTGATSQITSPGTEDTGSISFDAQNAAAGTYSVTVIASDGATTASAPLTLVVAVVSTVQNSVNTSVGVNGRLQQFMSTSFQPAEWDYDFFFRIPTATTPLTNLNPQHIRLQGLSEAVPMKASSIPPQPTDWNFTMLDDIVQPVLGAADHSPEFQIAVAPGFMDNASGYLDMTNHLNDFAAYCANLVRYYNTGGFDWGGKHFQSASANKITWWGIFNEYNLNGLTPSQYVQLHNAVVPAMQAVDPTIKFSALELSDYDSDVGDPRYNLPSFVRPANMGGVNAQVDVASTHFYSSCDQKDTDRVLFDSVPAFAEDVRYFYQELKSRPDLANVPVWVTENNVNADYDANGSGISACNGTPFVIDLRGTSAFFAAWRPYIFSQLGQAGSQALYHWEFSIDPQYGEVDFDTGKPYLSYWVDYYLQRYFPSPPGSDILTLDTTDSQTVEILATRNGDGSAVVMVANRAVRAASDNNGPGDPRTVVVDVSGLGAFTSASLLTIDANTDTSLGPAATSVPPAPRMTITLNGYGVAFLYLKL
jgi:Abnormal spindle-like microcephaly-assoc'd, ASPM-SPD-2-Hydin